MSRPLRIQFGDQVVYQKRLANDLPLITQQLSGYRDRLQGIVVESTFNWYWLVDGLMDQEHRIHLANTAATDPSFRGRDPLGRGSFENDVEVSNELDEAICALREKSRDRTISRP